MLKEKLMKLIRISTGTMKAKIITGVVATSIIATSTGAIIVNTMNKNEDTKTVSNPIVLKEEAITSNDKNAEIKEETKEKPNEESKEEEVKIEETSSNSTNAPSDNSNSSSENNNVSETGSSTVVVENKKTEQNNQGYSQPPVVESKEEPSNPPVVEKKEETKPPTEKPKEPSEPPVPSEVTYRGQTLITSGCSWDYINNVWHKEVDNMLNTLLENYRRMQKERPSWFNADGSPKEGTAAYGMLKQLKAGGINP